MFDLKTTTGLVRADIKDSVSDWVEVVIDAEAMAGASIKHIVKEQAEFGTLIMDKVDAIKTLTDAEQAFVVNCLTRSVDNCTDLNDEDDSMVEAIDGYESALITVRGY